MCAQKEEHGAKSKECAESTCQTDIAQFQIDEIALRLASLQVRRKNYSTHLFYLSHDIFAAYHLVISNLPLKWCILLNSDSESPTSSDGEEHGNFGRGSPSSRPSSSRG